MRGETASEILRAAEVAALFVARATSPQSAALAADFAECTHTASTPWSARDWALAAAKAAGVPREEALRLLSE
jgi:hypothetical protein